MDSVSGFEPFTLTSTLPVLRSPNMVTGSIPVVHYTPSVVRLVLPVSVRPVEHGSDQLVKSQLLYLASLICFLVSLVFFVLGLPTAL